MRRHWLREGDGQKSESSSSVQIFSRAGHSMQWVDLHLWHCGERESGPGCRVSHFSHTRHTLRDKPETGSQTSFLILRRAPTPPESEERLGAASGGLAAWLVGLGPRTWLVTSLQLARWRSPHYLVEQRGDEGNWPDSLTSSSLSFSSSQSTFRNLQLLPYLLTHHSGQCTSWSVSPTHLLLKVSGEPA